MPKTIGTFTIALLLASLTGLAETPRPASLASPALAAILAQPTAGGSCAALQGGVRFAATSGQTKSVCSATANCASGGTVSCQDYVNPADCHAFDHDCAFNEPGHVVCNGVASWCSPCPDPCSSAVGPRQKACCRCNLTGNCWDCDFCAHGFFTPDACP